MKTTDVATIIIIQSQSLIGVTLNILPPKLIIIACTSRIIIAMLTNPLLLFIEFIALRFDLYAFALNMFQNCIMTNIVKNNDNS